MPRRPSSIRFALLAIAVVLVWTGVAGARTAASDDTVASVPAGGPPPPGSGPITIQDFVRATSGDTIEPYIGNRVTVGLVGIEAPEPNTECGAAATNVLQELVGGGVVLHDDSDLLFDASDRRWYRATTLDGGSIALQLVSAGVVWARNQGSEREALAAAQRQAKKAHRGCLWRGASTSAAAAAAPETEPAPIQAAAAAATVPSGLSESVVASGLNQPTAMAFLPDGRILVTEKSGLVRLIKNGALQPAPFLDLRSKVNDYYDRGLLGIAVDPAFSSNGYIYLLYTYESNAADYTGTKTGRLSRFTASGDSATLGTEKVVLGTNVGSACSLFPAGSDCIPQEWYGHAIGNVRFASDGSLFVTIGDAASWNTVNDDALRAQNLDSLAGKVLHVTTDGKGLATNPFYNGDVNAARSKVWASGVRNAYRFNLRPGTDIPYIGDVGWNSVEEVNVAARGANLGWPCYEGDGQQSGYSSKSVCQTLYAQGAAAVRKGITTWSHSGQGAAVTGGAFYSGSTFPAEYQGAYFFADYVRGWIQYLKVDGADNLTAGPTAFATGADGPVDLEMGPDNNLYYIAINTGEVRRIQAGAAPPPPGPGNGTQYLSDLTWTSATNGWGPVERDRSNGENLAGDGNPLTLNGVVYPKGLGVHAVSDVRYNLAGSCSTFNAQVGIDDEMGTKGTVVFQVFADGVKVFDSGVMNGSSATRAVAVNVTGKNELRLLVTNGGDNINSDHADWADAKITCGSSNAAPVATIASPASTLKFKTGDVITYSGSATDAEDGAIPASGLSWQVILHHCEGALCHEHFLTSGSGASDSFTVPDHGDNMTIEIKLIATDSTGATGTTSVTLQPQTVQITLSTAPAGMQVTFAGDTKVAPATWTAVVGGVRTISAPTPQGTATFSSWSDGGAAAHDITIGTSNATYTATFSGGQPPGGTTQYISDMTWTVSTNGWGPVERDRSNGENLAGDGNVITLNGVTYTKGLGVHAVSDVRVNLAGACSTFNAQVGIDDEMGTKGTVAFQVFTDGAKVFDSGVMNGSSATQTVAVNVTGKNELRLAVTNGGDNLASDHADWADAKVTCSGGGGTDTTPPIVSSTTPPANATGVAVNANVSATFSEALNAATVSGTTFTLTPSGGSAVSAAVTYDSASRIATLDPSADLQPSTSYTARVKGGSTGVKDIAGNALAADYTWSFTTAAAQPPTGTTRYLSDLTWTSATNGWGPVERDRSNGENQAGDGNPLTLNGVVYPKGLGVHAVSDVRFNIAGACSTFTAQVGIDDEMGTRGTVVFQVWGDGTKLSETAVLNGASATQPISVSVAGRNELRLLVANGGDNLNSDHADWADAKVTCTGGGGTDTTPPIVSSTTPPANATGVAANASVSATFSEALNAGTVSGTTFTLTGPGSTAIPAAVTYDSASNTATLDPAADLQPSTSYTARVKGGSTGVKDVAGNALAADYVWSFTTGSGSSSSLFATPVSYAVGTNPHGIASADLNGDAKLDLVVANAISNNISVLLGNGNGTFGSATTFASGGQRPKYVALSDLSGDGKLDLMVANQNSGNVAVMLGNGSGGFGSPTTYAVCASVHATEPGDFNGDGKKDLATACSSGTVVNVLIGNGDGTFQTASSVTAGSKPTSVAVGDLNGDNKADLAVAAYGNNAAAVLLGNGDGTFQAATTFGVGTQPHSIKIADLNKDGKPDLVTANDGTNNATVLIGSGNGSFAPGQGYGAGSVPKFVAVGDLNGDGNPDLVVTNTAGNGDGVSGNPDGDNVSVLLGNGNGTFGTQTKYFVGQTPFSAVIRDFNGDGKLDLATANYGANAVGVLLNAS